MFPVSFFCQHHNNWWRDERSLSLETIYEAEQTTISVLGKQLTTLDERCLNLTTNDEAEQTYDFPSRLGL